MSDWLTRFSIKIRLISLLALLSLLAVLLTVAGLSGMRSSNSDLDRMFNGVLLPLDKLGDLANHMHHSRTQLLLACSISLAVRLQKPTITQPACTLMP